MQGLLPLTTAVHLNAPVAPGPHSYKPPSPSWSTVPWRVVTTILHFVAHGDDLHKTQLVNATHICRSWRSAALLCPTLWTNIQVYATRGAASRSHDRAAQFVARAARLPISMSLGSVHLHRGWLEVIFRSFYWVQKFRIASCTIAEEDLFFLHHILGSPAPLLAEVHLDLNQELSYSILPVSGLAQAPCLKFFSLCGQNSLPMLWSACSHWKTLTQMNLEVKTSDNSSAQLLDLDKVLDCLRSIKGTLEKLALTHFGLCVPEGRPCRPVALPRLKSLIMEGDSKDIILLLAHLDLDERTLLDLAPENSDGDDIIDLFLLLGGRQERFVCLRFLSDAGDHIGLEAYRNSPGHGRDYSLMGEPPLKVHITCRDEHNVVSAGIQVLRSVCGILPDKTLTVLDITQLPHLERWDLQTWEYVLEGVQGIQELRVRGKVADQLCEVLGWWRPSVFGGLARGEHRQYFLPDLTDLVLEDVIPPECLPKCLQARAEAGCPLRSLRAALCGESEAEVNQWQELLRQVVDDLELRVSENSDGSVVCI